MESCPYFLICDFSFFVPSYRVIQCPGSLFPFFMKDIGGLDITAFDAFLFDLDGTLVDGSDKHFMRCVHETAEELGHPGVYIPPGTPLRRFLKEKFPEADDEFFQKFLERNKEKMFEIPRPVRFHDDAEVFLKKYTKMPKAIVTNCHDWEVALTERDLDIRQYFSVIIHKTPEVPSKPSPDLYLKAAERLGAKPEECLVFEDSVPGVAAGKAAGMTVVGIDRNMGQDLSRADYVIDSFLVILGEERIPGENKKYKVQNTKHKNRKK